MSAREEAADQAVAAARQAFGAIDVLVNLAGIRSYEPLAEGKRETWERMLAVNLLSYAAFIRAAIGDLRACGRGSIVNISSTHAVNPRAGMGQYDVTKAGIVSLTKTLAFEEARHGVRVNAVCPGATLTPFHLRRAAAAGRTQRRSRRRTRHASACSDAGPIRARSPGRSCGLPPTRPPTSPARCSWSTADAS